MRLRDPHVDLRFRGAILPGLCALPLLLLGPALATGAEVAAADQKLPSGKEIMERAIDAIAGKEALAKIHNRVGKGTFEIKDLGIKGKLTIYQARPNKTYTRIEIEGLGAIEQGTDGKVVWELNPITGPRVKEGKERAALLLISHFDETELMGLYEKIECAGVDDVEGQSCYKVVCTPKEAMPITTYYSKATGLPVKMVLKFPHQMGEIEVENLMHDYREVDGILLPHRTIEKAVALESHMTINDYEQNADLPKDRFDLPAQIKKLVERAEKEAKEAAAEEAPPQAGGKAAPEQKAPTTPAEK